MYQLKQVCLAMKLRKMFIRRNFITNQMKPLNFPCQWNTQNVKCKVVTDNFKTIENYLNESSSNSKGNDKHVAVLI